MDKWFTHDDPIQFLFLNDLLLAPIFIFIIIKLARIYISKKKNPIYKKYFMTALSIRFASAILMALIYQFYYDGGGDTLAQERPPAKYFHKYFQDKIVKGEVE